MIHHGSGLCELERIVGLIGDVMVGADDLFESV